MNVFLLCFSGIAWTIVYIKLIKSGFKEKTYGIPLFALSLNLAWEAIYSYADVILKVHGSGLLVTIQGYINIIWFILDIIILITFLKFGRKYFINKLSNRQFYLFSIITIFTSFAIQIAFILEFDFYSAVAYSAFLQNLLMSIAFIYFFYSRKTLEGQSLLIAISKWLGTLAPTILFGFLRGNIFVIIIGLLCSIFDIIYILLIINSKKTHQLKIV